MLVDVREEFGEPQQRGVHEGGEPPVPQMRLNDAAYRGEALRLGDEPQFVSPVLILHDCERLPPQWGRLRAKCPECAE